MIKRILTRLRGHKTEHKTEKTRKETCDCCKHIYYNSDGSVSCDSPLEHACLTSGVRMYKELK